MRAKDFLRQIRKIDKQIENKLADLARWRAVAMSTTGSYGCETGVKVQSSPNQQKMESAIIKSIEIEQEINATIGQLYEERKKVISVIEQLDATEYDVVFKQYVLGHTLQEIADMKDRSYSWCTTIHGLALAHIQKILDQGEY